MPISLGAIIVDAVMQFAVLVAAALAVQLTLERLHLPGLVGLLVVGMALGPGGFHVLPREPVVQMLGDIGLIYVMFMAGLEVDLSTVRQNKPEVLSLGTLSFLLCLAPTLGLALLAGWEWPAAVLLGTLVGSHTLLAYPIVDRLRLLHRRSVVTAIGGTLLTDSLALVVLAMVMQTADARTSVLAQFMPLLALMVVTAAALLIVPRATRAMLATTAPRAEQALYLLGVLLALSAITELVGAHKILGAFLAGICLNPALGRRDVLREHMEFVGRMLFVPFFFVSTGMLLELEIFYGRPSTWLLGGILILMVVLGKGAAATVIGWWFGHGWHDRLLMFSLTLPQAAATLAVTVTAHDAGLLPGDVVDAVIIMIFVTCTGGPLLTSLVGRALTRDRDRRDAHTAPSPPQGH